MEQKKFKELKERKIQLFSKLRLKSIFPGEWESIWKGEGIEFSDIKPFETGDDPREIDLSTLIQIDETEVIQRVVERQLKVYIFADFWGEMRRSEGMFFPSKPEIRDIAIGLCFSAQKLYCPVGFCAFPYIFENHKIKNSWPAKMGESHFLEIINWIIEEGDSYLLKKNDFQTAILPLLTIVPSQSLVFFVSDFKEDIFENDFTPLLKPVIRKCDFIPIVIRDPLEKDFVLKKTARIAVKDSEGRKRGEVYLTPQKLKEIQKASREHLLNLERNFKKLGIDFVILDSLSIDDCYRTLTKFFYARKMARR